MNEVHAADKKLRQVPSSVEEFVDIASFNEVKMVTSMSYFHVLKPHVKDLFIGFIDKSYKPFLNELKLESWNCNLLML